MYVLELANRLVTYARRRWSRCGVSPTSLNAPSLLSFHIARANLRRTNSSYAMSAITRTSPVCCTGRLGLLQSLNSYCARYSIEVRTLARESDPLRAPIHCGAVGSSTYIKRRRPRGRAATRRTGGARRGRRRVLNHAEPQIATGLSPPPLPPALTERLSAARETSAAILSTNYNTYMVRCAAVLGAVPQRYVSLTSLSPLLLRQSEVHV